ncbi:MAG: DEAD/DEAH box helicase [Clostridia bacterium]|nr:DEAD/DEAH box helicase [Clostridia bacterium]
MKFKSYPLKNEIRRALSELGFVDALEVQKQVFPLIFDHKDVVVKSQTGSGKTAAFAIPICNEIEVEDKYPQCIVIAPTRELALQIHEDIKNIGRYTGLKSMLAVGKTLITENRTELKTYPHVVVATPGRLKDLIDRKFLKVFDLKYLVLDEADELLNMGFEEQIHEILSQLPKDRQTCLFSATMQSRIEHIIMDDMKDPVRVDIQPEVDIHKKISQVYYEVQEHKKLDFMKRMLEHEKPTRCIIFANTQNKVESIFKIMKKWNDETGILHGGMEQDERMATISKFKRGEIKYLIATDLASRGLHVRNLSHVINFNLPFEHESYVHRIGRTGRVKETGIAINLCSFKESEKMPELEEYLGYQIERIGPKRRTNPKQNSEGTTKSTKFKPNKNVKFAELKVFAGRHSGLKAGDFMATITRINGVERQDLGKIKLGEDSTIIEISQDKIQDVARTLKNMRFKKKQYRVQIMNKKR